MSCSPSAIRCRGYFDVDASVVVGTGDGRVYQLRSVCQPMRPQLVVTASHPIVDMAFVGNFVAVATANKAIKFYTVEVRAKVGLLNETYFLIDATGSGDSKNQIEASRYRIDERRSEKSGCVDIGRFPRRRIAPVLPPGSGAGAVPVEQSHRSHGVGTLRPRGRRPRHGDARYVFPNEIINLLDSKKSHRAMLTWACKLNQVARNAFEARIIFEGLVTLERARVKRHWNSFVEIIAVLPHFPFTSL